MVARDREHQLKLISNPEGVKKYKDLLNEFNTVLYKNQQEKEKQLTAMSSMLGMINNCTLEVPKSELYRHSMSKNSNKFNSIQKAKMASFWLLL